MVTHECTRRNFLKATAATSFGTGFLSNSQLVQAAVDPYADAILKPGPPPMPENGSFTIVALPDTQGYSMSVPETYVAQTKWIVDERKSRNIACVLHLGDITNNNTHDQWKNAVQAMNILDGHVPYFMTLGNHDYSENGSCKDRTTYFQDYFPYEKFSRQPQFGGSYDREPQRFDNGYYFFSAGGRDFLVLSLEFGPRDDVVRWANAVVDQHPARSVILITHAFVYYDDTRYDWARFGPRQLWNPHSYPIAKATDHDINDGQQLWDKLISHHRNFVMTLNGHVCADGIGRVVTPLPNGQELPQLLVNYQVKPRGGDGWLRLLEFRPDGHTVMSYDYSVTREECNVSPDTTFSVTIPA